MQFYQRQKVWKEKHGREPLSHELYKIRLAGYIELYKRELPIGKKGDFHIYRTSNKRFSRPLLEYRSSIIDEKFFNYIIRLQDNIDAFNKVDSTERITISFGKLRDDCPH